MDRMKDYLKRIYGMDALSCGCILLSLIINAAAFLSMTKGYEIAAMWDMISFIPLAFCLFRFFSTNRVRRLRENDWFIRRLEPLFERKPRNNYDSYGERYRIGDGRDQNEETGRHFKFFKCPACRQKIRVPRGKGRIEITCPRCGDRFIKKT